MTDPETLIFGENTNQWMAMHPYSLFLKDTIQKIQIYFCLDSFLKHVQALFLQGSIFIGKTEVSNFMVQTRIIYKQQLAKDHDSLSLCSSYLIQVNEPKKDVMSGEVGCRTLLHPLGMQEMRPRGPNLCCHLKISQYILFLTSHTLQKILCRKKTV